MAGGRARAKSYSVSLSTMSKKTASKADVSFIKKLDKPEEWLNTVVKNSGQLLSVSQRPGHPAQPKAQPCACGRRGRGRRRRRAPGVRSFSARQTRCGSTQMASCRASQSSMPITLSGARASCSMGTFPPCIMNSQRRSPLCLCALWPRTSPLSRTSRACQTRHFFSTWCVLLPCAQGTCLRAHARRRVLVAGWERGAQGVRAEDDGDQGQDHRAFAEVVTRASGVYRG